MEEKKGREKRKTFTLFLKVVTQWRAIASVDQTSPREILFLLSLSPADQRGGPTADLSPVCAGPFQGPASRRGLVSSSPKLERGGTR